MAEKTYAVIKTGIIIDCIIIENLTDSLESDILESFSADVLIDITDEDMAIVQVGSLWDGNTFTVSQPDPSWIKSKSPQPYPSWIWSEEVKGWLPPVDKPPFEGEEFPNFIWNESMLQWDIG
jgi:hypothetical protein